MTDRKRISNVTSVSALPEVWYQVV